MAKPEPLLEHYIARVLGRLVQCTVPARVCVSVAVGAHSSLWLLDGVPAWLAPSAVVAACVWLVLGVWWAWARCPVRSGLSLSLTTFRHATNIRQPRQSTLLIVGAILLIGLALPYWTALVLWSVTLLMALGYPRWGARTVYVIGSVLAISGVIVSALPFVFGDQTAWIGPTFAAILLTETAVMLGRLVWSARKHPGKLVPLAWWLPVFIPWLLPWCREPAQIGFAVALGLVLWPALTLVFLEVSYRFALGRARQFLAEHEPKSVLGRQPPGRSEDELRENDGYCQLVYPVFRHWLEDLAGESGYLTWYRPQVECVAFRSTSLFLHPCLANTDGIGRVLATLARELLPDLNLTRIDHLNKAFREGWNVARLTPREIPLAKMPWDHPWLLLIPLNWTETIVLPAGCGLHDRDEFPCVGKKVSLRIRLREEVLAAVAGCARTDCLLDPAHIALCQKLLWNSWRILPGAYESLLTELVGMFRGVSVTLFMEHDESLRRNGHPVSVESKAEFLERLNCAWNARLPFPLQELIEVAVSDMFVDTYLIGDVRQRIFELRVREANRPLDLQACVNDVRKPIEELFTTAASDGQATLGLRLNQELQGARQAILKEAGESRDRVVRQLGKMEEGAPRDAFSAAQEHITTGHERFVREVDLQFTAISSQLKEVVQIYGERTWQEQSSSPAPTQNAG